MGRTLARLSDGCRGTGSRPERSALLGAKAATGGCQVMPATNATAAAT